MFGENDFTGSDGWLDRFKARHDIVFRSVSGESSTVDAGVVVSWKENLGEVVKGFAPADVFNADETALFWKLLPASTFAFRGDKCKGGKHSKDRITLLVGSNATGTEKLPLLAVGHAANPRCFKNVKKIPVDYQANRKAWMTSELFKDWVRGLNA